MTRKRIDVVDDDPAFLWFLQEFLPDEGFEVHVHTDVPAANAIIQREQPGLAIIDVLLGGEPAGLALLQLLRSQPSTSSIPVILTSVEESFFQKHQELLSTLQCALLLKRFDIAILLDRVLVLLGLDQP